jgi:SAM-dependent methyltransferase
MTSSANTAGSPSISQGDYWWYRARADLLQAALAPYVGTPKRLLDVGSADGPSVSWLRGRAEQHVSLDIDPRGLEPGGVCGSALQLPFADGVFDVVAAFDVIEHCEPESTALTEVARVLAPGGRLLMSVPAYQWAWSRHDDWNHHQRRYTRKRAVAAVSAAGLEVQRATYAFAGTFPMFAVSRLGDRFKSRGKPTPQLPEGAVPPLQEVTPVLERILLGAAGLDRRLLRRHDLPFGSSVVVAAVRPGQ